MSFNLCNACDQKCYSVAVMSSKRNAINKTKYVANIYVTQFKSCDISQVIKHLFMKH